MNVSVVSVNVNNGVTQEEEVEEGTIESETSEETEELVEATVRLNLKQKNH